MEIIPFVGFANVKFGQTKQQVIAALGEPTDIWEEEVIEGHVTHEQAYVDIGVQLSFSADDDFRLGTITFMTQEYMFQGQVLVGLSEVGLLAAMGKTDVKDFQLDDDFPEDDAKDYLADSIGLSCWIEGDEVSSVSLFPEYTADGETVIWPK